MTLLSQWSYERIAQYSLLIQLDFGTYLKFELAYSEFALPSGKTRVKGKTGSLP